MQTSPDPRVVVVGAGMAGLTAARDLRAAGWDVLVLDQRSYAGGTVRRTEVAGVTVDVGAEAMLNRRPEGVDLAHAVGLEVTHPAVAASRIWTRGELRPLPRGPWRGGRGRGSLGLRPLARRLAPRLAALAALLSSGQRSVSGSGGNLGRDAAQRRPPANGQPEETLTLHHPISIPIRPSSSPMIARIMSVCASGR